MFIRRYDHQTEEGAEHQAGLARLFSNWTAYPLCPGDFSSGWICVLSLYLCIGLVLLLLEQIKPIEQLVPVS